MGLVKGSKYKIAKTCNIILACAIVKYSENTEKNQKKSNFPIFPSMNSRQKQAEAPEEFKKPSSIIFSDCLNNYALLNFQQSCYINSILDLYWQKYIY